MKNFRINILVLITAIILSVGLGIFFYSSETKVEATPIKKPVCWSESYIKNYELLRWNSWRDKTFVKLVNVHNAWEISEGNMDFILTVEAESQFDPNAIGDNGEGHGFCQWNRRWHSETLNHPEFKDPIWQMEECFRYYTEVFNNGTINDRLYGFPIRDAMRERFKFSPVYGIRTVCNK